MKSISICVFTLFLATAGLAAEFIPPSDRGMVHRSEAVIAGSALHSYSQTIAGGAIETVTTISVQEVIKGSIVDATIDIHEPGGIADGHASFIPGVPRFTDGEQVILFLRHPLGVWRVTDIALGKFSIQTDVAGEKVAVRAENDVVETNPASGEPLRRSADGFLRYLRAEVRGLNPAIDYFVPYHVLLRPQSNSLRIAPNATTIFTATSYTSDGGSGLGVRWCQNNCGSSTSFVNGVPFYIESGTPAGDASAALTAITAWNSDNRSGAAYLYGVDPGTHTSGVLAADGANTILFEQNLTSIAVNALECPGVDCPGAGSYCGVLGVGGTTQTNGQHTGPDGATFWSNSEVDVSMNQGVTTCGPFMASGDFPTAVTHEVGHTLGFRHSDQTRANNPAILCSSDPTLECSSGAVMKSFVPHGLNAVLTSYDQDAVRTVYPWSRFDSSGDGLTDLFWRDAAIGADSMWFMNGPTVSFSVAEATVADPNFQVVGIGDFDGDGKADVLWRNGATGANVIWFMNGGAVVSSALLPTVSDTTWVVAGVGDFQGDGKSDILWHNTVSGGNSVWLMNGSVIAASGSLQTVPDTTWNIVGIGDFQGDGKDDILWRNSVSGANVVWLMNGLNVAASGLLPTVSDPNWTVAGIGDFNGDGMADVLWRHSLLGANVLWFMSGMSVASSAVLPSVPTAFRVVRVGDFQGDGKADIMWRDTSGDNALWLMNGPSIAISFALPSVPTVFQVEP